MIWYFSGLEKFVVSGYTKSGMKAKTIADLRWWLFSKYTTEVAKLPPTLYALKYNIFRSQYVALVLKRCNKTVQNFPDSAGFGWELENGNLVPVMTDNLPAPTCLIELSMCSCNSPCQTDR